MSCTKQDYEAIAAAVRNSDYIQAATRDYLEGLIASRYTVAHSIADHFAKNPRFDRAQFLKNCGVAS